MLQSVCEYRYDRKMEKDVAVTNQEKGKKMKCLEELEQKVLHIMQKNKELQQQVDGFSLVKAEFEEKIRQYEASLLKETSVSQTLTQEKSTIKNTIEELLSTIKTLEDAH